MIRGSWKTDAGTRHASESTDETRRGSLSQARTGLETASGNVCHVCGLPVDRGEGKVPRTRHEGCGEIDRWLSAVESRIFKVEGWTPDRAALLRSRLVRMANAVPTFQDRDARGRFRLESSE